MTSVSMTVDGMIPNKMTVEQMPAVVSMTVGKIIVDNLT
jgi:hypothetical protein